MSFVAGGSNGGNGGYMSILAGEAEGVLGGNGGNLELGAGGSVAGNIGHIRLYNPLSVGIWAILETGLLMTFDRTFTFPDVSGTFALGAGTLTDVTTNDITVSAHTHEITLSPGLLGPGTAQYQYIVSGAGPGFAAGWSTGFLYIATGQCLWFTQGGGDNLGIGYNSLADITSGAGNIGLGPDAGNSLTTGNANTAVGQTALMNNIGGDGNTAVGHGAGYTSTAASRCVFIGKAAGYWETGSDKLFIDNISRVNEADGRLKALIYGVFAAAVANQSITFNAGNMGFFGTAAIAQPTTAIAAATFSQLSGNAVNDASTFDGYTLLQVVKALRNLGLLT
jgi:hypothetical protein